MMILTAWTANIFNVTYQYLKQKAIFLILPEFYGNYKELGQTKIKFST